MKKLLLIALFSFVSLSFNAIAGTDTFNWTFSNQWEDGTPLPEDELLHSTIYIGLSAGVDETTAKHKIVVPRDSTGAFQYTHSVDLGEPKGTLLHAVVTVTEKGGIEGGYSKEVSYYSDIGKPSSPSSFSVTTTTTTVITIP